MNGTLDVNAEGRVSVSPDMVVLALSVQTKSNTSKSAYDTMNESVNALKNILKESGIADTDIQTTGIYLNPEYNYIDGTQKPNGFSSTHSLSVKVRKLADANTILDKVTEVPSTQIQSISYDLDRKDPIYTQARKMALEKARSKADEMASVSGVKIKKVKSISENTSSTPYPLPYQNAKLSYAADSVSNSTSISAGQLEYTTVVNVTYELHEFKDLNDH
jgi:uncharacterized protein